MSHSWYLANDMQFHWMSPFVLIAFYYSDLIGTLLCIALLVISALTSGIIAYLFDYRADLLLADGTNGESSLLQASYLQC